MGNVSRSTVDIDQIVEAEFAQWFKVHVSISCYTPETYDSVIQFDALM